MPHISKPFSGCDLLPWYYEQPGIQNMCFFYTGNPRPDLAPHSPAIRGGLHLLRLRFGNDPGHCGREGAERTKLILA